MAISPILSSTPVSSVSSNNKSSSSSHSMITGRKLFLIVLALVVVGHFTLMYIYKRHSEKNFLSQLDDNFAHADERTHLQMPFRTTNAIVENNDHNNNNNNNINKNNQEAANPKKTREEQAQITRHENWKQLIAQEEAELSKKIEELKALKEQEQSELQTLKEEKERISADNKAAQATTTTALTPLSTPDAPTAVVGAVPVLTGNAIMSAEDAHAVETGVSLQTQPPLESNSIIMPSSNDEIQTKQLFVIPVYDQQSMDEAAKFAVCLQNFMSTKTYEEQSEIIPIIYTIDIDRKHMKEMENWRYFDLVNLPMDRIISNALSASPMNKRVIQQYILRHLYKRFRITKKKKTELIVFPYRVANKKDLFDLPAIGSLLNIESQCAGPIMQKKFALVVPFPRVQIAEVLEQLKRWGHHKPCVGRPKIYGEKTDLIFYYHTTKFPHLEDIILRQLSSNGKSNGPLRSELYCFNPKITFRYTNLLPEEDSYPSSANRMFYRLMFDNTVYTQYRYHFYAEPDTFPIRDGWLTRILDQAYVPDTPWWVSGSIYRGKVAFANRDGKSQDDPTGGDLGSLEMNIHVNGNALYSFSSDFREFVTMMLNDNYDYAAYDLAFTQFLFRYGWRLTRKVWHHFLFSDFILNMWKTDWTEQQIIWDSPNTYLVHSKQIKEDAFKKKEVAVPAQKQPETVP